MSLPLYKSDNQSLTLLQTAWASLLNPVLDNSANNSILLKSVKVVTGSNTINHLLGKKLTGWKIVRQRSASSVYDNQDDNPKPELTLVLVSTNDVVLDIEVF